jgi:hypothetical protein
MAKGSKKKNKAKNGGGAAAMDTSEGAPATSTAAEAPERNFVPLCLFFLISDLLVFHSLLTRIFRSFFFTLCSDGYVRGEAAVVGIHCAQFDQQVSENDYSN